MKKLFFLPFLLGLSLTACENTSRQSDERYAGDNAEIMMDIPITEQPPIPSDDYAPIAEMSAIAPQARSGGPSGASIVSQPQPTARDTVAKQIIKTSRLVYEVKNLQQANLTVDSLVKRLGGYVSSSNQHNEQHRHELSLVLKVPFRQFDNLMNSLATLPERVDHKSVEAQDVTQEYVDLRSRLKTKKKVAERYQELLQKAANVKEILEVEEKLRQLQEEIEAKEGQLRYLTHQVSYSTIYLNLYEIQKYEYLPAKTPHFGQLILEALDSGWQFLLGLILVLFRLWPLWIIVALATLAYKSYRKRSRAASRQG